VVSAKENLSVCRMKKKYSVTFVLRDPPVHYPAGAFSIIFQVAHGLNESGIRTANIFIRDDFRYVPNSEEIKPNEKYRILGKVFKLLFGGKRIKIFYRLRLYKLFGVDYDFSVFDNVDCYYYNSIEDVKIETDLIIATTWWLGYSVNEFVKDHKSKPLLFVPHTEDDPIISGVNSIRAESISYLFNFKKIVINRKAYERFKDENPLFFHVGIDTNFFKVTKDLDKRGNVVLIPLRKQKSKGAKYAIESARKLLIDDQHTGTRIIMFGNYEINEIPADIRNKIEYHYRPSNRQLLELYNKSRIFVLPSIVEGMSLPPLEAMACGCAVVVTDNGGISEYIVDGFNGLICPIEDAECLSNKVLYLLRNKQKCEEMIRNGLETAKQFSYEHMNKEFTDLIKTYLEHKGESN